MKKVFLILSLVSAFFFVGCKSTDVAQVEDDSSFLEYSYTPDQGPAVLSKYNNGMFWKIEGVDKEGKPSRIFVLGTIHVGDEKLFPIPDVIMEAWDMSVPYRVSGEISTEDWKGYQTRLTIRLMKSLKRAKASGRSLKEDLTEKERELLDSVPFMNEAMYSYEPWVVSQVVSSYIMSFCDLKSEYSYDMTFINIANEKGINMEGLDPLAVQLDVLEYGDWDYQLKILKDSIKAIKNPKAETKGLKKLYKAYLTKNEKVIEDYYMGTLEVAKEEVDGYSGFTDALLMNRNTEWAKKFKAYLDMGGNTFIFAGTGHFIGEDSVFAIMRKNGDLK